ncbi:MAG TPA: PilZ domain-containing protein [Terracidiphilus sp.]|nr:PilZ domain-containing protein [Terracidiphilus sp.]
MKSPELIMENGQAGTAILRNEGLSVVSRSKVNPLKRTTSFIRHVAAKVGISERRNDVRACAPDLNVAYASGAEEKRAKVRDISPTGAYLVTSHRWLVGTRLSLTLQNGARRHSSFSPQVRLQAKVVRLGEDGVGVSFVHEYADSAQWLTAVSKAASLFPENGAVRLFRLAKALAFLLRFAPSAEERIAKLFKEELSEERTERALELILTAERLVFEGVTGRKSEVAPSLVLRIMTDGSKSHEEPMHQCWAGLLATSTSETSNDDATMSFAALLSKLEPVHVLILASAAQRAVQAGFQPGRTSFQNLHCTMDEVKRITRANNVAVIECALNRLYEFGLLELTIKPFGCASLDTANLTPTELGIEFYQACIGQEMPAAVDCSAIKAVS